MGKLPIWARVILEEFIAIGYIVAYLYSLCFMPFFDDGYELMLTHGLPFCALTVVLVFLVKSWTASILAVMFGGLWANFYIFCFVSDLFKDNITDYTFSFILFISQFLIVALSGELGIYLRIKKGLREQETDAPSIEALKKLPDLTENET